jgi:hypothetical protein
MNTSQIFSHFQALASFMGAVNRPLQIPERTARKTPPSTIVTPLFVRDGSETLERSRPLTEYRRHGIKV